MKQLIVILSLVMASSVSFADLERVPASYASPDQLRQEISKLKAEAVGKDGKPNLEKLRQITEKENRLSELDFKNRKK